MKREEVLKRAWDIMLTWKDDYTFESYVKVIDMISDYNGQNPDDEIFFCEDGNKYYLEDDCIEVID